MAMSKDKKNLTGAALAAGAAIGSAAIAAGLLYASKRRKGGPGKPDYDPHSAQGSKVPSGEDPQTD